MSGVIAGATSGVLTEPEAYRLLGTYGIEVPRHGLARSPDEAAELGGALGFPLVMKIVSADVLHKSDVGGVVLGVGSPREAREAFVRITDNVRGALPEARLEGVLLAAQAPAGVEIVVGSVRDQQFGPAVMFGLGGVFVEVLKDVSFRLAPVTDHEAGEMIREIRGYSVLAGLRGRPPADVPAIQELLVRVSRLAADHPAISEMDLNPVIVRGSGLWVVDARVVLALA